MTYIKRRQAPSAISVGSAYTRGMWHARFLPPNSATRLLFILRHRREGTVPAELGADRGRRGDVAALLRYAELAIQSRTVYRRSAFVRSFGARSSAGTMQ